METVGSRIREERERLRISQAALIARLGIAKSTQINYESDKRAPDALYLAALADAGMDVAYIVTGMRAGAVSAEERDVLARLRAAPRALRAGVVALLGTIEVPASESTTSSPASPTTTGHRTVHFHGDATATSVVNGDQHIAGDQVVGSAPPARPRAPSKPRKSR
jgi:transcriptional regulator with XRE-family HTH domain